MHRHFKEGAARPPLYIVLLTDFGLADPYAGQMRAVLHGLAPRASVLDLSHSVPPHDIRAGAFFLASSLPYYRPKPVFLIVVDPGVGSGRALLCLYSKERVCIAPDNGILSLAAKNFAWDGMIGIDPDRVRRGVDLLGTGRTFHGRDIIAPLGARLALGEDIHAFGDPLSLGAMHVPDWSEPLLAEDGLSAAVLHVDGFGNVVLNLNTEEWREAFSAGAPYFPRYGARIPLYSCYAQIPRNSAGLVAGSQGYLELACNRASAARLLELGPGCALHMLLR